MANRNRARHHSNDSCGRAACSECQLPVCVAAVLPSYSALAPDPDAYHTGLTSRCLQFLVVSVKRALLEHAAGVAPADLPEPQLPPPPSTMEEVMMLLAPSALRLTSSLCKIPDQECIHASRILLFQLARARPRKGDSPDERGVEGLVRQLLRKSF